MDLELTLEITDSLLFHFTSEESKVQRNEQVARGSSGVVQAKASDSTISLGCKGKNVDHLQNQTMVPHLQRIKQ